MRVKRPDFGAGRRWRITGGQDGFARKLKQYVQGLLIQLYPNRCPVCGKVLYDTDICPGCRKKLKYVTQPACFSCGKPLDDGSLEYCADCRKGRHEFRQGKAVFCYQGQVRGMLYRYKYGNRRDYTEFFAKEAARLYAGWIRRQAIELIVPVPLSAKKMRKRGYNQAEIFAKRLAELVGLPCGGRLLVRTRDTAPQKQLSAQERKNNLKNAFKIRENIVNLKRVLLVDDIYTTGSTIDAASLALKQAGVKEVYFLCISIGQGQ